MKDDSSTRPTKDTGFRMKPTEPSTYTPRKNPPTRRRLGYLYAEDIVSTEPTHLRGVNYIVIDYDEAEQRIINDIRRNITRRNVLEANYEFEKARFVRHDRVIRYRSQ
jgi:hypothetical protein